MNNFQKITQNIETLLEFLEENTNNSKKYWREFLEKEAKNEDNN